MRLIKFSPTTIAGAAGLISLIVYLRTLGCGFVIYDDPDYVLNNLAIRHMDFRFVVSAFTEPYNGWWMPLTWISLAIDYHFWELNPLGYHLTNILLHSLNTGLVVLITARICNQILGPNSGDTFSECSTSSLPQLKYIYPLTLLLSGLIWGIHPLRVESVAWVTERKDVLNGLFSLTSILLYLRYVQRRDTETSGVWGLYLLSLLMFALSLMAKSVSVVLPVMLLVIDWFPLRRLHRGQIVPVLVEKIPFLLLSLAMVIVTIHFTSEVGYLVPYSVFPFSQRLAVSGNALFEYCRLMLFPVGIIPFYLIPDPIPVSFTIKATVFMSVAYICFQKRSKQPWLLAALLLFLLPLLPVLAFFQNGDQALAARFTYLPSLAPVIFVALALAVVCSKIKCTGRCIQFCCGGALALVLLYATCTVRDIAVWRDSLSVLTRVIELQPEVATYKERGKLYASLGNFSSAVDDFSAAISMATGVWQRKIFNLYAFRGEAYRSMGKYPEAVRDFTTAISLYPHRVYYFHRGLALSQQGNHYAAEKDFARTDGTAIGALEWFEGEGI